MIFNQLVSQGRESYFLTKFGKSKTKGQKIKIKIILSIIKKTE